MPRKTKVIIGCILSMGTIGSAALLVRLPYLTNLGSNLDFLYQTTGVAIWSVVEPGMGIVAGSLATLRPLLVALQGRRRRAPSLSYQRSERRPYHSRRLGSDERVLGASGSAAVDRSTIGTPGGDVSLEKLDLEGRGDMRTVTMISVGERTTRWSGMSLPHAALDEDEAKEERTLMKEIKRESGVEVRTTVRQTSIEAPTGSKMSSLDGVPEEKKDEVEP